MPHETEPHGDRPQDACSSYESPEVIGYCDGTPLAVAPMVALPS